MKKIVRVLILLIISFSAVDVYAASAGMNNASLSGYSPGATTIQYRGFSESTGHFKNVRNYSSPTYRVSFGGNQYQAMCIDPGLSIPRGALRCEPAANDASLMHIRSLLETYDWNTVQLAARFTSVFNGYTYYQDFSDLKYALVSYLQIRGGHVAHEQHLREAMIRDGLCSGSCSQQEILNNLVWGDATMIETAYNLSREAASLFGSTASMTTSSGFLYSATGAGRTVTVRVTSKNAVPLQGVTFECGRGCTVSSQSWSGTNGVVTLQLQGESCAYELKTKYPGTGPYLCRQNNSSQTLLIFVEDGEM